MNEPWDKKEDNLLFDYKGFQCHVIKGDTKVWRGYVAIPADHPIVGEGDYSKMPIDVHGGLTFGEFATCMKTGNRVFIMGFDCGHLGDLIPLDREPKDKLSKELYEFMNMFGLSGPLSQEGVYRDREFVKKECEFMVDQVIEFKDNDENK